MVIKESFFLEASTADILAAPSRLNAIPRNGTLTIEMTASTLTAANQALVTLQTPDGDTPFEDLMIGFGQSSASAGLDTRTETVVKMQVAQGGHVLLSYTEVGTVAFLFIHVTLTF